MPAVPNTVRRGGTFYFRRIIPSALRTTMGRAELLCSLRTSDVAAARLIARRLYIHSEQLIAYVRSNTMLTETDLAPLVQDFYATVLDREGQLRLLGKLGGSDDDRRARAARWAESAAQFREDLGASRFETADFVAARAIKKHGLSEKLDSIEVRQVQQAMLRAGIDLAEALAARFNGDFNFEPRDKLLKLELDRAIERNPSAPIAPMPATSSEQVRPLNSGRVAAPMFSAASDQFRQRQQNQGKWTNHTAMQGKATYRLFEQHCGDRPLDHYDRADMTSFRDVLLELPATYSTAPEYRDLSLADISRAVDGKDVKRLSPRTAERHLHALSVMWAGAVDAGHVGANIFEDMALPPKAKASEQRHWWPPEKLKGLFDTPIWRGCKSQDRRSNEGTQILRDEKWWIPVIALFSGMRQEEICQLSVDCLRQEEGVWLFDINDRDGRKVKNRAAVRLTPVHSGLERFGLLDLLETQKTKGETHLFPMLERGGFSDRLGHNYSKFFTRYRQRCGVYQPLLDFHSLRHSATTFMMRNGAAEPVVDYITGHARKGETARYTKGFRISQLKDTIELLDPEIDLDHLLPR